MRHIGSNLNEQRQLVLVINNQNADFIVQHLANYLRHSSELGADDGARSRANLIREQLDKNEDGVPVGTVMEAIQIKFDCSLYHKTYKEEVLRILLKSSTVIGAYTKLRYLTIYDSVMSNQDFYQVGQIIG